MKSSRSGSVAPKERVNIRYTPAAAGPQSEKELPLRLLFVGDFSGQESDVPLEEREAVAVDKNSFSSVMERQNIGLDIAVPDVLSEREGAELDIHLKIKSLDDFSPDAVVKQIPELSKLMELREALNALKGPLGNMPSFRRAIEDIIGDEDSRQKILAELSRSPEDEKENSAEGGEA